MLRVTLLEDFGSPFRLMFGYEVVVPMHFGAIADPTQMVNFSKPAEPLPAQPRLWSFDWASEDMRTALVPPEVVFHYFGDMRSLPGDHPLVRDKRVPNFNDERQRVAMVWGDYLYSALHGPYTTVRIAVPVIPKVLIQPVNQSGIVPSDAWAFKPHEFWKWEDQLVAEHEQEMVEYRARRRMRPAPPVTPTPPASLDISNLSGEQLDELAKLLIERNKAKQKAG